MFNIRKYWVDIFYSIFYRDHRLALEKLFVFVAAIFCFIPKTLLVPAPHGIDQSWAMAINYVVHQQLQFGTDFVFTYGPLGYLLTGYGIWVPVWPMVLYKAFIFFCSMLMALRMIRIVENWTESFLLALLFFMAAQFGMVEGGLVLLLIMIFLGLEAIQKKQWLLWLLMVVLTTIVFFIKINTGFIGILLLGGFAILAWRQQQLFFWQAIMVVLAALLLILGLSYPLHVSIVPYMVKGMQIISGFQDTMGLDSWYAFTDYYAGAIMLMVVIMLFCLWRVVPYKKPEGLFLMAMLFGFFLLVYKQGFIRADTHQYFFFGLVPFAFALFISHEFAGKLLVKGKPLLLFIILLSGFGIHQVGFKKLQLRPAWKWQTPALPPNLFPDSSGVLSTIKNVSVDILPFEISYLLAAGLNYQPRPIPQGYSAYTPALDALNASHMLSAKAPDYVLYSNHSIIFRNAGWDETQTKIAILSRYAVADTVYILEPTERERTDTFLLLQKRPEALALQLDTLQPVTAVLNQSISLPPSEGILLMYADMDYSFSNRLQKLWLKPNFPIAELTYANGIKELFHAPLPILKGGVMVQSRLSMQEDGLHLFGGKWPAENKVVAIRLLGNEGDYKSDVRVRFVKVQLKE